MHIDKAAFLVLAGAISTAGACIVRDSGDDDENTGGTGASTSNTGGSAGSEGGSGGSGGSTCDDLAGSPSTLDCDTLATSCVEGVGLGDISLCYQAIDYFKASIAEDAIDCMLGLDATGTCQDIYNCRNNALAAACEDDVLSICADFASNCSPAIDQAECEDLVMGMNDTGRTEVVNQCGPSVSGCLGGGTWSSLEECVNNLL